MSEREMDAKKGVEVPTPFLRAAGRRALVQLFGEELEDAFSADQADKGAEAGAALLAEEDLVDCGEERAGLSLVAAGHVEGDGL